MIICHCRAVTDKAILNSIRQGAQTRDQLEQACGAGGACGGCRYAIDRLLQAGEVSRTPSQDSDR